MKTPAVTPHMELTPLELARTGIMPAAGAPANLERFFTLAAGHLKSLWRSVVARAESKRKTLSVRETAALGDRRFVSVIQFERQRYLIGSSPAAVTLLAQLPDDHGDRN